MTEHWSQTPELLALERRADEAERAARAAFDTWMSMGVGPETDLDAYLAAEGEFARAHGEACRLAQERDEAVRMAAFARAKNGDA